MRGVAISLSYVQLQVGLKPGGFFVLKENIARSGIMLHSQIQMLIRCVVNHDPLLDRFAVLENWLA